MEIKADISTEIGTYRNHRIFKQANEPNQVNYSMAYASRLQDNRPNFLLTQSTCLHFS
jgi:hypothetical protein